MKNMKRLSIIAVLALATCGTLQAKSYSSEEYSKLLYGSGKGFVGPEIGIENGFNIGLTAGYQYYFRNDWQFAGFRQGIRGWGNVAYDYRYTTGCSGFGCIASTGGSQNYNGYRIRAGADWTLDFNPLDNAVYGVFTGLSLGWVELFHENSKDGNLGVAWSLGVSAALYNTHRFEIGVEVGPFSTVSFRYLYMF